MHRGWTVIIFSLIEPDEWPILKKLILFQTSEHIKPCQITRTTALFASTAKSAVVTQNAVLGILNTSEVFSNDARGIWGM